MSRHDREVPRESDELWAARLLRLAARPHPLSPSELEAVGRRLRRGPPPRAPHWAWRVAVTIFVLLCGGALTAGAARVLGLSPFAGPERAPSIAPPAPAPHARRNSRPPRLEVAPASGALETEALAAPPAAHEPAPRAAPARSIAPPVPEPVTVPPSEPAPSALGEEAALVGAALRRLREGNDAAGALALLDEHDRRFGARGPLADEARATRVEAWLRTGEHARALAHLDGLSLEHAPTLLAARADLRAEAGRCAEARADFESLLSSGAASGSIEERALFGHASCLSREGNAAAARAELEGYLARFPTGVFAARARAALGR